MKKFSKLFLSIMLSMTTLSMVACGSKSTTDAKAGKESNKELSGTVKYALPTQWLNGREQLIDAFKEKYPNVEVEIIPYDSDSDTFLTTSVATGELPDIVETWNPLIYPLTTGVVQELDEFLDKDDDYKNVPENIRNLFKIDGKTYAVPYRTVTEGAVVNLDLLETLNADVPAHDWTIDEFSDLLKKASTDKYAGINTLYVFRTLLMSSFDTDLVYAGYDIEGEKFNYTNGAWQKQMDLIMQLRSVPNLQADALRNETLTNEGKEDDYQKKFGKDVDAFNDGKQLMKGAGTWELDYIKPNFNWDFYVTPSDSSIGYAPEAEVDYIYMLNTAEDKEATFELLKWMSYGEEGVLANLEIRESIENPVPHVLLPVTQTPAIKEKVEASTSIPEGLKYFYNNLDKARTNPKKVVPGFEKAVNEVLQPTINSIFKGEADAASVAAEMEKRANDIISEEWSKLRSEMGSN